MSTHRPPDDIRAHRHAVQFYGNERSLFATVAGFIGEGLVAGESAIVIATADHSVPILDELKRRLIDVKRARSNGELVVLDAEEMLANFMTPEGPDAAAFELHVGGLIEKILAGRERVLVRAYGEMVDVLWKRGLADQAIELELLWNKLASRFAFSLLCGYSMGNFYKQAERFLEVCRQHTDIVECEPNVLTFKQRKRAAAK